MSKRKRTVSTDQDSELIDQLSGILSNISDSQDGDVSSLQGFLEQRLWQPNITDLGLTIPGKFNSYSQYGFC